MLAIVELEDRLGVGSLLFLQLGAQGYVSSLFLLAAGP